MMGRGFGCQDVDRLLDLEDLGLRPDRKALAKHMSQCSRCRELAPELEWLYGRFQVEVQEDILAPRWRLRAAALLCFLVAAALPLYLSGLRQEGVVPEVIEAPAKVLEPRLLPAHQSHFEAGVIRLGPEHDQYSKSSTATSSPRLEDVGDAAPMEWTK